MSALKIPFFAIQGNHEYMFRAKSGNALFARYFPAVKDCAWRSVEVGPFAVILLNSNFSELSTVEQASQLAWLKGMLTEFDRKASIRTVLVLTHYPPFTNSTIVSASKEVRAQFLPPFLAARKTVLFLSGHAHTFEHFREQGKDFAVIGGGGGLLHPLKKGSAAEKADLYPGVRDRGFFHYLKLTVDREKPRASVFRYDPDRKDFLPDYSWESFGEFPDPTASSQAALKQEK